MASPAQEPGPAKPAPLMTAEKQKIMSVVLLVCAGIAEGFIAALKGGTIDAVLFSSLSGLGLAGIFLAIYWAVGPANVEAIRGSLRGVIAGSLAMGLFFAALRMIPVYFVGQTDALLTEGLLGAMVGTCVGAAIGWMKDTPKEPGSA